MLNLTKAKLLACVNAIKAVQPLQGGDPADKVALFINNISPDLDSTLDDFTLATFNGSAPKDMFVDGNATVYSDPLTGEYVIEAQQALAGLNFVCTAAPGAPETVYGYIITNAAGDTLLGGEKFDDPILISEAGQGINIAEVEVRLKPEVFAV